MTKPIVGGGGGSSGGGNQDTTSSRTVSDAADFIDAAQVSTTTVTAIIGSTNSFTIYDDIAVTNNSARTLTLDLGAADIGNLTIASTSATTIHIKGTAASVSSLTVNAPSATVNNHVTVNGSIDIRAVSSSTFNNTGDVSGNIILSGPGSLNDTQTSPAPVVVATSETVAVLGNSADISITADDAKLTVAPAGEIKPVVSSVASGAELTVATKNRVTISGTVGTVLATASELFLKVQGSVGVLSTTAGTLEVTGGGSIETMTTANTVVSVDSYSPVSIDTLAATGGTINAPDNAVSTVAASGSVVLNATVNTVTTAANTMLTLGQDASVNSVVASGDLTLSGVGAVNSVDVVSSSAANITKSADAALSVAQVTTTGAPVTTALVATVLAKAARPMSISFAAPTAAGGNGMITGADGTMEYRAVGTPTWTAISGTDGLSVVVAAGTYEVRVAATDTALASEPVTVAIPAAVAVSTAAIQGTPHVGQTLTAVANAAATGQLSYVWKAGDTVISGETRKTLTLTDAQIGKTVTVTISNYNGTPVTSASTLAVTVDKAALTKLIFKADEVQQGVSEKPDGTTAAQVAKGIIFVTASEKSALLTVRNAAVAVRAASTATTTQVAAQEAALRSAVATYVAAKKTGTLDAVETLKTELEALISLAQSAQVTTEATESSAVEPSKNYVLAADNVTYTAAINTATAAKDAANATAATLSNAIKALNNAMAAYLKVIRTGAPLDNTALTAAINAAEKSAASVVVNTDASNVLPGLIWVTQDNLNTYNAAIAAAKTVPATVQNDYIRALTTLNTATAAFNADKSFGVKDIIPPVVTVASAELKDGTVTVVFTSSEDGSYKYRLDRTEGAWTTPSDNTLTAKVPSTLTFPLSASSATVYVQVSDASGNTTVVSASVGTDDPADTVASIGTAKYATLAAAVAAAFDGQTVKLAKDVTLTETVSTETTFTLDLNSHSITGYDCRAILVKGGTLTLGGTGTVSSTHTTSLADSSSVIRVSSESSAAKLIVLSGVTVSSDHCYGITLFGAANPQALDVYGTVAVTGSVSAISGNGSAPNKSTTVNIYEGAVVSATRDAAIYHPEKGTLTIAGGTITGTNGIEAKAGSVVITGGTISSTEAETSHIPYSNGTSTSGYAVALVENKAYSTDGSDVTVTITGGTFTGPVAKLVDSARAGEETLTITGGTFSDLSCMDYLGEGADVAVKLAKDVTLTDSIRVTNGATLNLDLNGHKISKASTPFIVYAGELNVTGTGTIEETVEDNYAAIMVFGSSSADASDYAVVTVGQDVTLSGWAPVFINRTNVDDNTWGVPNTQDHAYGVSVYINGTLNSPSTTAPGHAAYINGTIKDAENCPAVTIGGTAKLTSKGTGIYAAGYADWTIEDGAEITGATGIEVRAGKMEIGAASVTGTAAPTVVSPNGNGTTTNGAGIAVAQHTTKLPIDVTLNGSIVKSYTAFYQSNPQKNSAEDIAKIKVSITGGAFRAINEGTNAVYSENLICFITGGTFSGDPGDYLADGYAAVKHDTENTWTVTEATKAALTSTGNVGIAPESAGDAAGKMYAEYELAVNGERVSLAADNIGIEGYIKVKIADGEWTTLTPDTDATLWFNVEAAQGVRAYKVKTGDGAVYTATLVWSNQVKEAAWEATGGEGTRPGTEDTYVEYKLMDGENQVFLKAGVAKLFASKAGSKWQSHELNTDETLWIKKDVSGSFTYFIVAEDNTMYMTTLEYAAAWDGTTTAEPKTEDGAYIVNDANEFAWFMGKSVTGQTIKLNKDINLGGHAWAPLANSNNFVIDGNGHTIRNFTLTMSGQDGLGMFGCKGVTGATIKNLVIEDAAVTGTHIYYAGVLVGDFHDGTIEDITVRNVSVAGYKWVGAVAGQTVNSTLKNITVENATVKATGDSKAGGVAGAWRFESGKDAGTAENLVVRDSTITAFTKQAGGIFGNVDSRVTGIQMIDCVSEGNVIGSPVAASTACLVGDIYIGSGYPKGVILTINNPIVNGNTAAEGFIGPGTTLVGGDIDRWDYGTAHVAVDAVTVEGDRETLLVKISQDEPEENRTITASISPANASNKSVTWSSDNEDVATVDANGIVTGISGGYATITVRTVNGGFTATKHVVVGDILVPAHFANPDNEDTLQSVIDGAAENSVIVVAPAEYKEQIVINKPLTLLGPNAGIAGYDVRNGEAVITYPDDVSEIANESLVYVTADNVVIKGLSFYTNEAEKGEVVREIWFTGYNNEFTNNRVISYTDRVAVHFGISDSQKKDNIRTFNEIVTNEGTIVKNNYIESTASRSALYLQGRAGVVEGNTINGGNTALQIHPYWNVGSGTVKNNKLYGYNIGIWHNRADFGSGAWTYEGNEVFATSPNNQSQSDSTKWRGILIQSHGGEGWGGSQPKGDGRLPVLTLKNNSIDGSDTIGKEKWNDSIGLYFYNNFVTTAEYTIDNNTFKNIKIGANNYYGNANLEAILTNNTFPEGSEVIGNEIKVPTLPQAYVTQLELENITVTQSIGNVASGSYPLDVGYKFETTESYEEAAAGQYAAWNADFVVSFDKAVTDVNLYGQYATWQTDWEGFQLTNIAKDTPLRLLGSMNIYMNYAELCSLVRTFSCGATDVGTSDEGATMTVELRLYEVSGSAETGNYEVIGVYSHTF